MQTKQSRGKEAREVVGVGRPRKRVDLSKEFDEFKQRIQEFENKNEEIISRIRDAYTVKKKAVQEYPHVPVYPSAPQFPPHAYHHNDAESEASSCDYSQDVVF
jgi:glutamate synthase domain-containing protein 2